MEKKKLYNLVEIKNGIIDIVVNNTIYGSWDKEANLMYPEDLTLEKDLSLLIEIGIQIGIDIEKKRKEEFK